MKLASAYSVLPDTGEATAAAVASLLGALEGVPDLLVVYATEQHARQDLIDSLRSAAPAAQIVGGTSCGGVMTEAGFHAGPGGALGLLGVADADGSYGVGAAPLGDDAAAAAAEAVKRALSAAGRDFESPVLVWCCQPPGQEEAVIAGIQSVVGRSTPIIGGSSADEAIAGNWRQFSADGVLDDHAVVAVLFPSVPYGAAFQSGYAPTEHAGVVTRASNRRVFEIDHRPAIEVYSAWTEGAIAPDATGMILGKSTPTPFGRVAATHNGVPLYVLSHPALVGEEGDLTLFTDVAEGDAISMMRGSAESLLQRAGLVVADACAAGGWRRAETRGGLVIYCGGCMLHVRDRMDEVAQRVSDAMGGAPFLGAFTFGEQGAIVDSGARHGNLMVSALTFG